MYGWAPLALLGEEINKLESLSASQTFAAVPQEDPVELVRSSLDSNHSSHQVDRVAQPNEGGPDFDTGGVQPAGTYLGIWNIFATVPQFGAMFIAMVAFSVLEPGRGSEYTQDSEGSKDDVTQRITQGLTGTAACLAIGAVCSCVAATLTFRLHRK